MSGKPTLPISPHMRILLKSFNHHRHKSLVDMLRLLPVQVKVKITNYHDTYMYADIYAYVS